MNKLISFSMLIWVVAGFYATAQNPINKLPGQSKDKMISIPLGGNSWASNAGIRSRGIYKEGIRNWSDSNRQFETWFRINQPGKISVKIRAKTTGSSKIQLEINGITQEVIVQNPEFELLPVGEWILKDTGYVKINLAGISKTGINFADISDYEISGSAINEATTFVKNDEGNFFYWGRRGPSVHLNYPFADNLKAEWFYNEVTVPEGEDVQGSYYMANGFGEGYFGIQVNSPTERRILFSVWSSFHTDDPKSIPEDEKIIMLRKGEGVHTGEFGNEGSGGQSYLKYPWKAGTTYRFLLNGYPDGKGNTIYTAFFFAPDKNEWQLIASFLRPKTNTYLKRFHSFLENFDPEQGNIERHVLFGNQWISEAGGQWQELNKASFTYDNTAAKGYRKDYAGGVMNGQFFLQNCGFFNHYTHYNSQFTRPLKNKRPVIDFEKLKGL